MSAASWFTDSLMASVNSIARVNFPVEFFCNKTRDQLRENQIIPSGDNYSQHHIVRDFPSIFIVSKNCRAPLHQCERDCECCQFGD